MRRGQRGLALINVLLVVALATAVCAGLIARQQLAIRAAANQLQASQALHYALGGEALAQGILSRDLLRDGAEAGHSPVDHPGEPWARSLPPFPIEQGEIVVTIEDLSGRFNLNSLVRDGEINALALERFRRLLHLLGIEGPYPERLLDWLDGDQQTSTGPGAEDRDYLRLAPAYRSAGRLLADASELRLLLGMQEKHYRLLLPHVAALPPEVGLNVNTASPMLLACLDDALSPGAIKALLAGRGADGYRDLQAFLAHPALIGSELKAGDLTVGSRHFRVYSDVRLGARRRLLASTLLREADGRVRVLRRDLGQAAPPGQANP